MTGSEIPVTFLFILSGFLIFLSAYAAAHRRVRAATEFSLLMGTAAAYTLGYGIELSRTSLEGILQVVRFEYLGISLMPAFWFLFALRFSRGRGPTPILAIALFAIPLVVIAAEWTNDLHHLYYARTWLDEDGPFPVIGMEKGPIYWVNFAYLQICLAAGNILLVLRARSASPIARRQSIVASIGSLGPWAGNVLYLSGAIPLGLEPSSFFLTLSGFCYFFALFRMGMLELAPIARDRAIGALSDGFLVIDAEGHVVDANEAAVRLLGDWARGEGASLPRSEPGGAELGTIFDRGEAEIEFALRDRDGAERRLSARSYPVRGRRKTERGSAIVVRDITETAALLARLAELAGTDELTGLPNRRRFLDLAERELAIAVRERSWISLAILDIDRFKEVNDRFGHAVGDSVLREFAARLARAARATDILCRYGGEEFAVVFPGTDPAMAMAAIERIRAAVSAGAIAWDGGARIVRASAGVYSSVPARGTSLDEFLAQADGALYEAKESGRDRAVARDGGG